MVVRSSRRRASLAAALSAGAALVGLGASLLTGGPAAARSAAHHDSTTGASATGGGLKVAYYDQWSIYQNAYYPKALDTGGAAGKLDYLLYDFENIDPANLTCFEATKAADQDENDPNAGDGAGDAYADYQKTYGADTSVNGQADTWNQPLVGNFNQLKELKAKYPHLKILLSLGGWTYSKYFSDAAATDASRKKLVSSCVDMFIKGNLPAQGGYGGAGTAKGIFDGFDIDWEYPGGGGHVGNHSSPSDKADYTALLAEFRSELDAQGQADGRTYALSAALPAGQDKIANVQTDKIGQYLTFADAMTYDMHGGWEPTGPTNHQAPLYDNPSDPSAVIPPGQQKYSIDEAVRALTAGDSAYGIPGGFPPSKLNLGVPFYYRGWTGVPAGSDHGLFQTATGPAPGAADSGNVAGIRMYKELGGVVDNAADTYWDPLAQAAWFYDGTTFWSGEDARSIQATADYLHCNGLGGTMMFSLYDDPSNTLLNDVVNATNGSAPGTCPSPPSGSPTPTQSTSASASPTPTPTGSTSASPTPTSSATGTPPASGGVVNGGFESGALSPWTCSGGLGTVQNTTVHGGQYALEGNPSSADTAQCQQTITVKPGTAYTLSGYVDGNYTYLGVSGTGGTDTSTWTSTGGTSWQKLSTSFTTGASTTSVTVYVHGWYGQGSYTADDISVS
ncbi:glycoside hydrolase [Mangrovactinospora gilvigrisea]|uniref:chitinase n=1 Tax=Mangrovactinospora gilvigrisea TaxID=1428644 RepID=A0A1J7BB18_9ACTN|nr:glycosyl hydrolase family 18 protein [Mangrovactinospora gilvigrisea]OIV35805.1 glycoside hydrolase [Mangrovactinospora gilvigrisea]